MKTKSGKKVKTKRQVRKNKANGSPGSKGSGRFGRIVMPLVICACLLVCLGALGYLGYERVAASDLFDVRNVEVAGVERASKQAIETVVRTEAGRAGVWHADLEVLKGKVEKMAFVKSASVTRVIPDGIRVQIVERVPQALVIRGGRRQLVDVEGEILADALRDEKELPFVMIGWDESKTEKAWKENIERVKIYQKMVVEWRIANMLERVESVNVTDIREPRAVLADSGTTVSISVGRENYGENLMRGLKAIVGKGDIFSGVDLVGGNMILTPRKTN